MFEMRPVWYFFDSFVSCGLVSLNGRPALDRVGQEARPRRLQRPADLLGDPHGDAPQHLGVELVGAALDLALGLVEQRDDVLALSIVNPSLAASLRNASNTPFSQSMRVP